MNYLIQTSTLNKNVTQMLLSNIDKCTCGIDIDSIINSPDNCLVKYIKNEDELLSFCIYSTINKQRIVYDLESACDHFDEETIDYFKEYIDNINNDAFYIHFIESFNQSSGLGSMLVNSIINENKDIILYSGSEAEEFWDKKGFENIFGYEYFYEQTTISKLN